LFMDIAPPATHPVAASADPSQDRSDRTERHLRILAELTEIGMDLARAVRRQALAQAAPEEADTPQAGAPDRIGGGDLALVFSRIARAVRQTVALEAKLAEDRRTRDERTEAEQAQRAATIARERKARQKARVKRIVEQAIEAEADGSDREDLLSDLDERLEDDDVDADFGERPTGEIIARICRDIGITPDRALWEAEDWGIEAGAPEVGAPEVGAPEAGAPEAGTIEEAGTGPSPFASPRPAPSQTGRSPEPLPQPLTLPQSPRAAASGSDPP
jgi:hypothetical protein